MAIKQVILLTTEAPRHIQVHLQTLSTLSPLRKRNVACRASLWACWTVGRGLYERNTKTRQRLNWWVTLYMVEVATLLCKDKTWICFKFYDNTIFFAKKNVTKHTCGVCDCCNKFSPPLQLKWSLNRCHILASLDVRWPVQPPLHLWLPVLGFRALKEGFCLLSCFLGKRSAGKDKPGLTG